MPEQHLETSSEQIKPRKAYKSRKPNIVQQAVIARAMMGDNNSQIARELGVHRDTVTRLLSTTEIQQHVEEARSDIVLQGDLRKSVNVLRARLDKGSESAATTILRGFNVLRSGDSMTVNVQNNGSMSWMQIVEAKHELDKRERTTTNSAPSTNRPSIDPEST